MAQIFILASYGKFKNDLVDSGAMLPETAEAAEMMQMRNLMADLRSQKQSKTIWLKLSN
jgi:hypothetical protein